MKTGGANIMRTVAALLATFLFQSVAWAQQPVAGQAENTGPNASIVRWADGSGVGSSFA
jgi:hypothetical protein